MRKTLLLVLIFSPAGVAAFAVASCSSAGPAESESKMTSYSASETKADTATLFTVPQDQMVHVKVVPVGKGNLLRQLRLAGSVTYNAFKTTPVFSPSGGPVHEILVAPGETVHAGQPLLTVNSPDYSAARSAYLKARWPTRCTHARRISTLTAPLRRPICRHPNPAAPRRRPICRPPRTCFARWG